MVSPINSFGAAPSLGGAKATAGIGGAGTTSVVNTTAVPQITPSPGGANLPVDLSKIAVMLLSIVVMSVLDQVRNAGGNRSENATNPFNNTISGTDGSQPAQAGPIAPLNQTPKIAVIDDFNGTHGPQVINNIQAGAGGRALDIQQFGLNPQASTAQYEQQMIGHLQTILNRVKNGEKFDAVNISQASTADSPGSQQIRNLIGQITTLGVPVMIAAGNDGRQNQLIGPGATVIPPSGGLTSSFAAAQRTGSLFR